MSSIENHLFTLAREVGVALKAHHLRLVLAESCTGGVVSMALTDQPGISEWFCGSAVTYRNETKAEWLGAARDHLQNPKIGPVSPHIAEQMCLGALQRTPEADIAASITGHLGPNAPEELDGIVFIAIAFRGDTEASIQRRTVMDSEPSTHSLRYSRQREAATFVLQGILTAILRQSGEMEVTA